jgi:hypothetical protein
MPPQQRPQIQRTAESQVSYTGSRTTDHMSARSPRKAGSLSNVYPLAPGIGAGVVGRPGTTEMAVEGSPTITEFQWVGEYTKQDGTSKTIAVWDGEIWEYDYTTDDRWERLVTTANFATATITVSTTGRWHAVTFNDLLVLSDGVNLPFTWDGTSGAGGLTELTNAAVAYGPPTVYYAKLFFIKNAERNTIIWSEEADPTTGYEAGGFNNAWSLRQTNNDGLERIYGTNRALYYWRASRIGAITGAVNADFQTTGVNDAISDTIGTRSPDSVVFHNGTFFFIDGEGRPQSFREGAGMTVPPLWNDAELLTRDVPDTHLDKAIGVYRPLEDVILIAWTPPSETVPLPTDNEQTLAFTGLTGEYMGVWDGYTASIMGMVRNDLGQPRMVHADNATGKIWAHGDPENGPWSDDSSAGSPTAIAHQIESGWFMWDPMVEKAFDRTHFSFVGGAAMTDVRFNILTPYSRSDDVTISILPSSVGFVWDVGSWDSVVWGASAAGEAQVTIGWDRDRVGRWAQVQFSDHPETP